MFAQIPPNLKKYRIPLLVNLFLFSFYFSISSLTPYQADDFRYKINPLSTDFNFDLLKLFCEEQISHYNNWGGRILSIGLLHLFLIPAKFIYDIVNSIFHVLLINTLFFFAYNRPATLNKDAPTLLFINILLYSGFYAYSSMAMYMTSSINYTWMHLFVFIYYLVFTRIKERKISVKTNILFFIFGLIVGGTNEHIFIAQLSFFVIIYFLYSTKRILKIPKYFFYSLSGVLCGGLILIFSPGNFVRAQAQGMKFNFNNFIEYINWDIIWLFSFLKPFWLVVIPLILYYYFIDKNKINISVQNSLLLLIGLISSLSLSVISHQGNHTNLFFYYCLLIATISLMDLSKIKSWFGFMNIIVSILLLSYILINQNKIYHYNKITEKEILRKKTEGELNITVESIKLKTNRLVPYLALYKDSSNVRNMHIAKYYGINSIRSTDKTIIE